MRDLESKLNEPPKKGYVLLTKDRKIISRAQCCNAPIKMTSVLNISDIVRPNSIGSLSGLPHFFIRPASEDPIQQKEWGRFLGFLKTHERVAIANIGSYLLYIVPPNEGSSVDSAVVLYRIEKAHPVQDGKRRDETCGILQPKTEKTNMLCGLVSPMKEAAAPMFNKAEESIGRSDAFLRCYHSADIVDKQSPDGNFLEAIRDVNDHELRNDSISRPESSAIRHNTPEEKNYVRADPSYLKTLGQAHSGWIFGAIAELVDNSRDAKAIKLEISMETVYSKNVGTEIPMLSVIDDGHGMTHQDIVRMISFGHKEPDADDPDHIGRFGIGFKTGAMRLGKDALVLTQTANSRSIAFLSQSLNEGKDNLEIPIVSYSKKENFMEVDSSVQTELLAKNNLKAIKKFSPFNKYLIGEKAGLFRENGTGTQIYIWNLDKWGSDYSLKWETGFSGGSSFHQGDIIIRSKRIRSRPGQTSRIVPLDYSLRSYLEVIFLDPRMKIYVQGSLVKSRPLAKSLNKTVVKNGFIMGKPVQLTLGRCQLEWEQANCGIFLYWHGRLIEAYKRVGRMIHSADIGRGVIGVIDVTQLMSDANGHSWVHSNKQGFQDCELYAHLEDWLGERSDQYWFKYFEKIQLKRVGTLNKPDNEWVQCDKCRKWRMLSSSFDSKQLPQEWFCYMEPFNGKCETPEQKVGHGVVTVSQKLTGYDPEQKSGEFTDVKTISMSKDSSDDDSSQTVDNEVEHPSLKRIRRGPPRVCKQI